MIQTNCSDCLDRLGAFLDGALEAGSRREMERHLRGCAACRDLAGRLGSGASPAPPGPEAGIADAVLARTTGSTCGVARERLCDHVDGLLGSLDDRLVRLHLEACEPCSALARALAAASTEVGLLAELDPGPALLRGVLARTTGRRRVPVAAAARLERFWARLLERPRVAWELAYVGTFALALIFVTPASPFASVPGKAFDLARVNPVRELHEPARRLEIALISAAEEWWGETRRNMAGRSRGLAAAVAGRIESTRRSLDEGWGTLVGSPASEQADDEAARSTDERDRIEGD